MDIFSLWYLWIKAAHLIAVISWMAGLLYLPRLFVYHCAARPKSSQSETYKVMERRLYRFIMMPAMIASWVIGLVLLSIPGIIDWSADYWIYAKLVMIAVLTLFHIVLGKHVAIFAIDKNVRSPAYFRIANEVPTIIMVGVVILVVVKPF